MAWKFHHLRATPELCVATGLPDADALPVLGEPARPRQTFLPNRSRGGRDLRYRSVRWCRKPAQCFDFSGAVFQRLGSGNCSVF